MTDIITLIEQDLGQGRHIGGWLFWHCPFHAGDNTPSLGVRNGRYYCFACQASGDAVDWLVNYRRLPKKEALDTGKGLLPNLTKTSPARSPGQRPGQHGKDLTSLTAAYAKRLDADDPLARAVRAYLSARSLSWATWQRALLGAAEIYDPVAGTKRPAVAIPYCNKDCKVRAVKYRFCNGNSKGLRYIAEKGSVQGLYHLPEALFGAGDVLLIIEGELNLLSVAQINPGLDVVSPGSQSAGQAVIATLRALARRYQRVVIWFDEPKRAQEMANMLGGKAKAIYSPTIRGVKCDANQLLCAGLLGDFLERMVTIGHRPPDIQAIGRQS